MARGTLPLPPGTKRSFAALSPTPASPSGPDSHVPYPQISHGYSTADPPASDFFPRTESYPKSADYSPPPPSLSPMQPVHPVSQPVPLVQQPPVPSFLPPLAPPSTPLPMPALVPLGQRPPPQGQQQQIPVSGPPPRSLREQLKRDDPAAPVNLTSNAAYGLPQHGAAPAGVGAADPQDALSGWNARTNPVAHDNGARLAQ